MLNARHRSASLGFDPLTASERERRRAAVRDALVEHVDAENAGDMERTLRTYAENCAFEDVPTGRTFRGKAAIGASYQERFDAFPDLQRIITRLTVDDRSGVAEITMRGRQTGLYRGFPPTDGVQELQIVGCFELDEQDPIIRETAYYDHGKIPLMAANPKPEWITRGKTIAGLIKELQSFEDQSLEVRISIDDGETTKCISLVAKMGQQCVLMNCEHSSGG